MTVAMQHPGFQVPEQVSDSESAWFRTLLVLIAVAVVAATGYVMYESTRDRAAPAVTFEEYSSHETIEREINAAVLGAAAARGSLVPQQVAHLLEAAYRNGTYNVYDSPLSSPMLIAVIAAADTVEEAIDIALDAGITRDELIAAGVYPDATS